MSKEEIVNKERLYKVYLDIFLKTDCGLYNYDDDSSKNYIKYRTDYIIIDDICYRFTVSREKFFFKYFYNAWVDVGLKENISILVSDIIYVYFKSKDIKPFVKDIFNKIKTKNEVDVTNKFIPIEYQRSEKVLKLKENIK